MAYFSCVALQAPSINYKNYAYFDGTLTPMEVPRSVFETDVNSDWTIEVVFYDTRTNTSNEAYLICTSYETAYCRKRYSSYYAVGGSASNTMYANASEGEHTVIINDNRKCYFDGVEIGTWAPYGTDYDAGKLLYIGARDDGAYKWDEYIKKVKVTKNSTGDVICEYKPAIIDDEPCLYDEINDSKLTTTGLTVMDEIPIT